MLVAGVAAGFLGIAAGGRGWEGLFVALNPGLLYAAAHDLSEPLCAALTTMGLLAFVRGRRGVALICFALLPLSKEPLILVPLGLAAWGLLRRRIDLRGALALCATVLPSVVWWVVLRVHLGAWFFSGEHTAFRSPLHGWERAILDSGIFSYAADPTRNQIGEASLFVIVALGGLLLVAAAAASRLRDPLDAVFLPLVVLVACLSPAATSNERDILRVTSVVVLLVPFVLLSRPALRLEEAAAEQGPDYA
jgi:hypothetical protein